MCLAKRNAFAHKVIRCFRGQQGGIGRGSAQAIGVELCCGNGTGGNREHVRNLIVRGEEPFFVLLQVALIASRQTLKSGQQAHERAGDAAGLPASAPEPMGHASALSAARSNRAMSRMKASACASRKCESRIGCACCMWVMPAMGTPRFVFACNKRARSSPPRRYCIDETASMT